MLLFDAVLILAKVAALYILIGYPVKDLNQLLPSACIQTQTKEPIISLMRECSANLVGKGWVLLSTGRRAPTHP